MGPGTLHLIPKGIGSSVRSFVLELEEVTFLAAYSEEAEVGDKHCLINFSLKKCRYKEVFVSEVQVS